MRAVIRDLLLGGDPWSPLKLPGAGRGWWSMRDFVGIASDPVASVPARLGGIAAVQGSAGSKPTLQFAADGRPICLHTADDFLTVDGHEDAYSGDDTPFSIFASIYYPTTLPIATEAIVSLGVNATQPFAQLLRVVATTGELSAARSTTPSGNITAPSGGLLTAVVRNSIGVVFKGTNADFWLNNTKIATAVALDTTTLGALTRFTIGCLRRSTNSAFFNGGWGEIFDAPGIALSDTEVQLAMAYLVAGGS